MKTELTDDLIAKIQQDIYSTTCLCGKTKTCKQSFAYACYRTLPPEKKQALWRTFGNGYEEAFIDAANFLGGHEFPTADQPSLLDRAERNDTLA